MRSSFSCCCSLRFWAVASAVLAVLGASLLPTLMAALLKHMLTAPHQEPWPHGGSLRLIDCHGIPAQALNSAERIRQLTTNENDIENSELFLRRDTDVWIVSYVKSGTTWTIGILAALYGHPAADYSGNLQKTTRTFCPQPELPDLGWGDDGFGHSIQELNEWSAATADDDNDETETNNSNHHGRCFKSHWPSRDFMLDKPGKHVYVMRNARDQMISHWNQVWGMGFHYGTTDKTFEGGWEDFVKDWLDGNVENGKWFDHVAGWYERSLTDPEHVMVVRYEDLKTKTEATIQRIASFVGRRSNDGGGEGAGLSEQEIARIMEQTSFEKMKEADANDVGLRFMRFLGVLRKNHIRQGETGAGNSQLVLSEEHLASIRREYESKLEPLGIPWEWVFQQQEQQQQQQSE